MTPRDQHSRWLIILFLMAVLATLYVQWPAFQNDYVVDDDWRHYYWMERYINPDAFTDDWIINNVKQVKELKILNTTVYLQYESWAFGLIYWLGHFFVDPITVNKIIPFGLMFVSVFYLFRYGLLVGNQRTAFLLGSIFIVYSLSAPAIISLPAGLERSFSFPMLIVFLYYFRRGSDFGVIASLALQAVIYFPIFMVCAAAYTFSLIEIKGRWPTLTTDRKRWLPLLLGVGLALLFFLPALLSSTQATLPYDTDMPVWENPYYSQNGRISIFWQNFKWNIPLYLIMGYGGLTTAEGWNHMMPLLLIFLFMLTVIGMRSMILPHHTRLLLWGSLASYGLVWIVALLFNDFLLRYPFKYTSAVLPLVLMILVAHNGETFSEKLAQIWTKGKGRGGVLLAIVGIVVLTVGLFFFTELNTRMTVLVIGALFYVLSVNRLALLRLRASRTSLTEPSHSITTTHQAFVILTIFCVLIHAILFRPRMALAESKEHGLYEFVATLPAEILFAGDPNRLSNFPSFSKRGVLFSAEVTGVQIQTVLDFYDAYYAESPDTILDFCQTYGVTHWLVDEAQFAEEYLKKDMLFFAPYNTYIKEITGKRSNFVLAHISDEQKLFQEESYFIVSCEAENFLES